MLVALSQISDHLIELQPCQLHAVHGHDLVARLQPGFGRRGSRHGLQHNHASRQDGNNGPETLALGILHLLELLVLVRIEEDGMRIQRAQHSRNRALVHGLLSIHRVRRLRLHDGNHVREALQRALQIFGGRRCDEQKKSR